MQALKFVLLDKRRNILHSEMLVTKAKEGLRMQRKDCLIA